METQRQLEVGRRYSIDGPLNPHIYAGIGKDRWGNQVHHFVRKSHGGGMDCMEISESHLIFIGNAIVASNNGYGATWHRANEPILTKLQRSSK